MPEIKKLKGVNLGGWLVLEKWMTPQVFEGANAEDEFNLSLHAKENINKHRASFITKQDFKWLAKNGINSVRLPVGHWIFGGFEPYIASEKYVDKALEWAKEYGLQVILNLHSAPGSQNGAMHSGQITEVKWHLDPKNIEDTIKVVGEISKKYGKHSNLYGIEIINEPSREIAKSTLLDFYKKAYRQIRKHTAAKVKVIFCDGYRPLAEFEEFINDPKLKNVLLDMHLYQTHYNRDRKRSFEEHIDKTHIWKDWIRQFGPEKIIVGEWSAVLHETFNKLPSDQAKEAIRIYKQDQELAFADAAGHFYWSYKTAGQDLWNYRYLVESA